MGICLANGDDTVHAAISSSIPDQGNLVCAVSAGWPHSKSHRIVESSAILNAFRISKSKHLRFPYLIPERKPCLLKNESAWDSVTEANPLFRWPAFEKPSKLSWEPQTYICIIYIYMYTCVYIYMYIYIYLCVKYNIIDVYTQIEIKLSRRNIISQISKSATPRRGFTTTWGGSQLGCWLSHKGWLYERYTLIQFNDVKRLDSG